MIGLVPEFVSSRPQHSTSKLTSSFGIDTVRTNHPSPQIGAKRMYSSDSCASLKDIDSQMAQTLSTNAGITSTQTALSSLSCGNSDTALGSILATNTECSKRRLVDTDSDTLFANSIAQSRHVFHVKKEEDMMFDDHGYAVR